MSAVSEAALDLIRKSEGFSAAPYLCPAKVWTIGYGSTRLPGGASVTASTPPVTREQAEEMLRADADAVAAEIDRMVVVPLTPGQMGALVSFVYNLGSGRLRSSTLLRKLNTGDYKGAAYEFGKWVIANGQVSNGLIARRAAEQAMFLS